MNVRNEVVKRMPDGVLLIQNMPTTITWYIARNFLHVRSSIGNHIIPKRFGTIAVATGKTDERFWQGLYTSVPSANARCTDPRPTTAIVRRGGYVPIKHKGIAFGAVVM